jgi:glucosamine-6-phosphate deaminase
MDVVVAGDREALGRLASGLVLERLRMDSALVLGVATGSSLVTTYQALVRAREDGADFSRARCVALDEYVGISETDPRSYHAFVRREIAGPLGVRRENVLVPDGNAPDLVRACAAFEDSVRAWGGVGVQLLGIGRNGHVGFNEPGSRFTSRTRQTALSATTRADNARFFARAADVPVSCLTQGIGTIVEASAIVLVASGAHKAEAVAAAVEGPVSEACPASILQRHRDARVILDQDAAGRLSGSVVDSSAEGARHVHSHLR